MAWRDFATSLRLVRGSNATDQNEDLAEPLVPLPGRVETADSSPPLDRFAPLSQLVVIQHLPGATKRDAEAKACNIARELFSPPSDAWFLVAPFVDGFALEVQDGPGRAYLPSILADLADKGDLTIAVPMARRWLMVQLSARTGGLLVEHQPEGRAPLAGARYATRSSRSMRPVEATHVEWVLAGRLLAVSGLSVLVSAILWWAFDPSALPAPQWRVTGFTQLPVLQQRRNLGDESQYIARMEFRSGRWSYARKGDPAVADDALTLPAPSPTAPAGGR